MQFVLAQGTHQATKSNFVLLAKEHWNWPLYHFCVSPNAILLLQNFLPTTDHRYPDFVSTQTIKIYHWYKATVEI